MFSYIIYTIIALDVSSLAVCNGEYWCYLLNNMTTKQLCMWL